MENKLPLEECSINQVYLDSHETKVFTVPVYQRNYAWEEDQITALVKDVHDMFQKNPNTPYYIGTLVTYKRGENTYEVIDGQQRLTTIYIILKVLGYRQIPTKLTYRARRGSASTIQKLDSYPNLGDDVDNSIQNGYKYAEKAIDNIVEEFERENFVSYFLHKVHIIHYRVPKDVELNHYFEVMNSRGEQLEKHEIVKSILSQCLKTKPDVAKFSRLWEACSEMNMYIQQVFTDSSVFGGNLHKFLIDSFDAIPKQDESGGKETILNLLKQTVGKADETEDIEQNDRFQPIIDFPNFLLIVLKLTVLGNERLDIKKIVLDDKELLSGFSYVLEHVGDKTKFVKMFTFNLLKAKYFLDNYMVHHALIDKELTGDNPWKLQCYYQKKKSKYPKQLTDNSEQQKELVHLLSMFEVSFTPKQRKNYLLYCMAFLFTKDDATTSEYLDFLRRLAGKYFYNVYLNSECLNERNQPAPNAFDNAILLDGEINVDMEDSGEIDYRTLFSVIYEQGRMDIPLFVFNYTDYILWRKYAYELRGNKAKKGSSERKTFFADLGCSDFDLDVFNNFYFSRTRKSLEHFYPQSKAGKDKALSVDDINCFGNFAMIGAEVNSSGSDLDPMAKLNRYGDTKANQVSIASLKFKVMMQICLDNHKAILLDKLDRPVGMEWNNEDMRRHQEKMLNILIQ